jgi:predicted ATPase/DNA-binding SARP family transcriptional activator
VIEYRVLGPLEVVGDDGPLPLGGAKQRALLALLLLGANRVVSRERLIDELRGDEPPATAVTSLQVYVSRLRKLLPSGALVTRPPGYLLEIEPDDLDLRRFERLLAQGHEVLAEDDAERAAIVLHQALELWRGPALAEFAHEPFAQAEIARLEDLRLGAVEERIEANLALGRHAHVIGELEALIAEHPHRERLRGQLMLAFYRSGRQAEALEAYRDARAALDELGIEPSEELRRLEKQILTQDATLVPARRKTNLPLEPTPLVGRTQELAEVLELLRANKLVTLTGAGGSGKTRLGLQAAHELLEDGFTDGVWFVPLAPLTDPKLIEPTIAQVLGARGELNEFLRGERLLLLLDNLEQLLPEAASVVARLETTVLVTSRERLNVTTEQEYPVPTLPVDDAVRLFTQRARQLEPRFEPDEYVPVIARRVDGLPLALELAAARVKALTPKQIVERLGQSLELLTGGARDTPERQRTLRATIEWSYRLLDQQEQALFARLAVFAGGGTLEAAEQVADAELDLLQSLIDKNLLRHREGRFWMLETIRELALEKLELLEDAEQLRRRHAEYLLQLLPAGPARADAALAARWSAEDDNVRAAVAWALQAQHADLALSLAGRFAMSRITAGERVGWLDAALLLADRADPAIRAMGLADAASSHYALGDYDLASELAQRSLDQFLALRDRAGQSLALRWLGLAALAHGDHDRARELFERSLELAGPGSPTTHYVALHALGEFERDAGNLDRAAALLEEALQLALGAGVTADAAAIEHGLGDTALAASDSAAAERHYRRALSRARELGLLPVVAVCLCGLASLAAKRGEVERAGRLWGASEAFRRVLGTKMRAGPQLLYEEALATVVGPEFEHAANNTRNADPDEALAAALAD